MSKIPIGRLTASQNHVLAGASMLKQCPDLLFARQGLLVKFMCRLSTCI